MQTEQQNLYELIRNQQQEIAILKRKVIALSSEVYELRSMVQNKGGVRYDFE